MKILIIEDEDDLRDSLQELLELHGHEVLAAADGLQGVALAGQSPDFIFCDVHMPRLDGYATLAKIRKMPGADEVPFVFLTIRDERDALRAGMTLGADDYITKPFSQADILGAIAARTKRHRGLRERIRQLSSRHQREIHAQWSHELLTPLNAVLGSLDLIEQEADSISRDELKEMLAVIREGAARQERLARKLIAYFELEQLAHASPSPRNGRCAAEAIAGESARQAARAGKREGDLVTSLGSGEIAMPAHWLAQAVAEVVENAGRYSAAGTAITVMGAVREGRYHLIVTDQGPGLSAGQRAQIGAFVQFDRHRQEQQGLGFGLAIARLTARVAGGELGLGLGPGGRGLAVEFDLPVVPDGQ